MFFIAAALVLTTAGVFAGKAKFFSNGLLVDTTGSGGYVQVNTQAVPSGFQTTANGQQVQISNRNGISYPLFYYNSGSYQPVYQTGTAW